MPPVGGKSAETTGTQDAAAGTTVTPVRAGHKGNRKKRRARRASKARATSTTSSGANSSADTQTQAPSPSAVAGSSTPEGRQALKNLQGVGR